MSPSERIKATELALQICLAVGTGELTLEQAKKLLKNLNGFEDLLS